VPQLFVATVATKWNDPKDFPVDDGCSRTIRAKPRSYAKYILKENPTPKIAVLFQNDDYGRISEGPEDGLGARRPR